MEAAGTPPQPAPPPPPPPSGSVAQGDRASGGWRALAVVLALALAFACAVMVVAMGEIADTTPCDEVRSTADLTDEGECFDGSSTQKTISLVLGWPSAVLAGIAVLIALYFAVTGRRGRLLLTVTGAAIVLGGLSIGAGSI